MTRPVEMKHPNSPADDPIRVSAGLVDNMLAKGWQRVDKQDLTEQTEPDEEQSNG